MELLVIIVRQKICNNLSLSSPFKDKARKEEALYHPRLTYVEPEEEEESEAESYNRHSDGSYSPQRSRLSSGGSSDEESSPRRRPGPKRLNSVSPTSPRKPERRSERMFDDSDDDSSTEKEGTNLNWTPAEVVTPAPPITTGTARRRSGPPSIKDPVSSTGSGLINLCANVPPVPGSGGAVPAEARSAAAAIAHSAQQGRFLKASFAAQACIRFSCTLCVEKCQIVWEVFVEIKMNATLLSHYNASCAQQREHWICANINSCKVRDLWLI